jgi:DNA polymerase-3 subunit epsilon
MFNDRVVFLDLETTGGSPTFDRIIEIGLVEIDRGRWVGEWSTLINPHRHIPQGVQTLTGITDEMVESAPAFDEVSGALAQRLDGKVLAAHNARFDYGFLRSEFRRAGLSYSAPVLCTVKLARRLFPEHGRHNLDALIVRHAIFCINRHRALGDAQVLWELAQIWRRELDDGSVNAACAELLRQPTIPAGLPQDAFDRLPEVPGVYILYGANDLALYVGRSANIRSRVLAHFAGDPPARMDMHMAREVQRVDWSETAGELGAYLQQSQLLKELAPVYNRQSRRADELCAWRWRPEQAEAPPELVDASELESDALRNVYGLFRSRASACEALRALASTHGLCLVMLGLEPRSANGACSAYPLNCCRGACTGAESAIRHAMRVVQALSKLRIKPWPYRGRVGLRETDPHTERSELHVVDEWCYLGTGRTEAEVHELKESTRKAPFDLDTYKMLRRLFKLLPRSCEIVALDARESRLFDRS